MHSFHVFLSIARKHQPDKHKLKKHQFHVHQKLKFHYDRTINLITKYNLKNLLKIVSFHVTPSTKYLSKFSTYIESLSSTHHSQVHSSFLQLPTHFDKKIPMFESNKALSIPSSHLFTDDPLSLGTLL